ncbi:MAG: tRNA (adenosine(37)-N6)-threonylcarbamoyltransferase complex ATPase subunit type 1 TsaE [Bacteroidales bacterium]|nr:tRNA (adenosine(37)-N6)-threonylcarbamoyltransferase complex ATPase subunit type 1 TsaE [Bacteroidales bacterium]
MRLEINNISEIKKTAKLFLNKTKEFKKFAFFGDMGVGKTTFIKELCKQLGVTDVVNSPSFAIVNEYMSANNEIIYHFDFYRIKNINEVFDFGYEEYFYSPNYCFVEWPEKIEHLLPDDFISVNIIEESNHKRIINIQM